MSDPLSREEFVEVMKASRIPMVPETAASLLDKDAARKAYERKKAAKEAEKAAQAEGPVKTEPEETLAVIPEGSFVLTREEAEMLSLYIRDTITWALELDRYFTTEAIFQLVHLADRLQLKEGNA